MNEILNESIVAAHRDDLELRIKQIVQKGGVAPWLGVVLPIGDNGIDPGSLAFVRAKVSFSRKIGANVKVCKVGQEHIPAALEGLQAIPGLFGLIVEAPLPNRSESDRIFSLIPPSLDVDNMRPGSALTTNTSWSMLNTGSSYGITLPGKNIAIHGLGERTTLPLLATLHGLGYEPWPLDPWKLGTGQKEIDAATKWADVIYLASGKRGSVMPGHLSGGERYLIDAAGDLSPKVFEMENPRVHATPERGAVGTLTTAYVWERVVSNAELPYLSERVEAA